MSLADQVVQRRRLSTEGGFSGNVIERVTLRDGRELIHKRVNPDEDWISRATGDRGRLVSMWETGLVARLPPTVDHGIVAVEADEGGWSVYMRDMSAFLLPPAQRLDRATVARVLSAMADVHNQFWGESFPELCSIEDRYHLLSPRTIERERQLGGSADALTLGWDAFSEHVPADIAAAVLPLVEDPTPLADLLRTGKQTLIHGDLRLDNLGFTDRAIAVLDWGERTGSAPPAVELMWFLGFDALRLDCTREEVIADFLALYGERVDERAMDLAFIGGFVHLGCHLGLGMAGRSPTLSHLTGDALAKLAAASSELSWWLQQVERALERSSLT